MVHGTRLVVQLLSGRWSVGVLYLLADGTKRFSELFYEVGEVSKKALTHTLRSLERDGLVQRRAYPEVPARVEYSLTSVGWSITTVLMGMYEWAARYESHVASARVRAAGPGTEANAQVQLLSGRWSVSVLYLLADGTKRFSELFYEVGEVSKKALTHTLRSLERDGLVQRRAYAEVPARVEYSLTSVGWSITTVLMGMYEWAAHHESHVASARLRAAGPGTEANAQVQPRQQQGRGSRLAA